MRRIILIEVVLCVAAVLTISILQERRMARMERAVEQLSQVVRDLLKERVPVAPGELYAAWYSAGTPPVLHEVKTPRNAGESTDAWVARHNAAVAEEQAKYPPV